MKTLHVYLLRQVSGTLAMTVGVFTFFILLVSVVKEVLNLLVSQQVSLRLVGEAVLMLIPFVMVYALPMGLLTAALLVFGRLSADQEITAIRASGVSLVRLVVPMLALSVLLGGVCAAVTLHLGPKCRAIYKNMLRDIGLEQAAALIPEKTYIRDFPGAIVYVSRVRGAYLEDILIYQLKGNRVESYARASSGTIAFSPSNDLVYVQLTNTAQTLFTEDRLPQPVSLGEVEFVYTNSTIRRMESRTDLDNMTFLELRRELEDLERRLSLPLEMPTRAVATPGSADRAKTERARRARHADLTYPVRLRMHGQVAFSFACIGFTLVGIPLGIRAHRRETSFGIAAAIVLVLIYYSFFILGRSLETRPELAPHLILWAPNLLFQVVGAALLWRANRGI